MQVPSATAPPLTPPHEEAPPPYEEEDPHEGQNLTTLPIFPSPRRNSRSKSLNPNVIIASVSAFAVVVVGLSLLVYGFVSCQHQAKEAQESSKVLFQQAWDAREKHIAASKDNEALNSRILELELQLEDAVRNNSILEIQVIESRKEADQAKKDWRKANQKAQRILSLMVSLEEKPNGECSEDTMKEVMRSADMLVKDLKESEVRNSGTGLQFRTSLMINFFVVLLIHLSQFTKDNLH